MSLLSSGEIVYDERLDVYFAYCEPCLWAGDEFATYADARDQGDRHDDREHIEGGAEK